MKRIDCMELMEYWYRAPGRILTVDIETTGFYAPQDEILSLSVVDGRYRVRFHSYFRPEHNPEWPQAMQVNGITPQQVAGSPAFAGYAGQVSGLLAQADVIVGYNQAGFDLPFMQAFGVQVPDKALLCDVMLDFAPLAGIWDERRGDWKWQTLESCAAHYGYLYRAHSSLDDARAAMYCARGCAQEMEKTRRLQQPVQR